MGANFERVVMKWTRSCYLKLECMNSLNQIGRPCQRGGRLGRVALHEARHMLLQGPEARSDLAIAHINPTLEVLPEALHRVSLGTVSWQPHQDDVLWYLHTLRPMRRGLVQPDDIETRGSMLAKLPQKDRAAVGIEAWQLPPAGVSRGRLHGAIPPGVCIARLNDLDWLDSIPCETTTDWQVETEPAFVLAEDPHGLRRDLLS